MECMSRSPVLQAWITRVNALTSVISRTIDYLGGPLAEGLPRGEDCAGSCRLGRGRYRKAEGLVLL